MRFPGIRDWQRYAPHVVLLVVMLLGALGVVAFYLALRPCVLVLPPGQQVSYSLSTEIYAEGDGGAQLAQPLRRDEDDIHLISLGADGEAALVVQPRSPRRGEIFLVQLRRDGQVLLRDGERLQQYGPAIGYFDFNLLALPPGMDQDWTGQFQYAYPPPAKRSLTARIRRTHNGARPRFRYFVPAIEWVDRSPRDMAATLPERYVQLRELQTTYRFDTGRQVWQDAQLRFQAGVEMPDGLVRHRVHIDMSLVAQSDAGDDPAILRRQIEALRQVQRAAAAGDESTTLRLLAELRTDPPRNALLYEHLKRWHEDMQAIPQAGMQVVQVASLGLARQAAAQRLRMELVADGYPAFIQRQGQHYVVVAGPFAQRDERLLADLRRRYPENRPFWARLGN